MKLHLLESLIEHFFDTHVKVNDASWYYPHSIVDHFHKNWIWESSLGLKEKYDLSLKSEISQRWWKKESYRPKDIMLKLIDADSELAAIAFKDLANEQASLGGRISRFNFYAEELLEIHRRNFPRDIETYHHQDAGIISLYLAGWYPDHYALYPGLEVFRNFCKVIGSPEIPVIDDLIRFQKVTGIVFKFLQRNPNYERLIEVRTTYNHPVNFLPYQTSYEIICFAEAQSGASVA